MDFLSFSFFFFMFLIIIFNYFINDKFQNIVLLVFSFIFYYFNDSSFFWIILYLCFITFFMGRIIAKHPKKIVYVLGLILIFSILAYFKYFNFLISIFNRFILVNDIQFSTGDLIPLGISFMTFQAVTYIGDIYYGKIAPTNNFIKSSLCVCYFPTVISGPIQKARNILKEFNQTRIFNYNLVKHGTLLFCFGALQKYYISNKLATIINGMLPNFSNYSGFHYLFFAFVYSIYIYSNFNSYSDMAIGISEILGIKLSPNFKKPYLSTTIKEFWQRWHISLNSWFVDYLYIPLGGSKKGKLRYYINIIIVFFCSGLWHGASFHFIAWGLLNAGYQIFGSLTKNIRKIIYKKLNISEESPVIIWFKRFIVFYLISIAWIFFAVPSTVLSIKALISSLFPSILTLFDGVILEQFGTLSNFIIILFSVVIFLLIQIKREKESITNLLNNQPKIFNYLLYVVIFSLILIAYFMTFSGNGDGGFIYGNF